MLLVLRLWTRPVHRATVNFELLSMEFQRWVGASQCLVASGIREHMLRSSPVLPSLGGKWRCLRNSCLQILCQPYCRQLLSVPICLSGNCVQMSFGCWISVFVLSSALCFVIRVVFFCLSSCETLTSCHSVEFKRARDKRLARLISYIHHTNDHGQYCRVGNISQCCRLGLFQDSDFAGEILKTLNSISGRILYIFGRSNICSQNLDVQEANFSVSRFHRIGSCFFESWFANDGIPAFQEHTPTHQAVRNHCRKEKIDDQALRSTIHASSSQLGAQLHTFEDITKLCSKWSWRGRSLTMRHVSRTHRVVLDWLFDRINFDPKIRIKYVDTRNQLAEILTKGYFTCDELNNVLHLFNILNEFLDVFLQAFFFFFSRKPCRRGLRQEGQEKSLWWKNQGQ